MNAEAFTGAAQKVNTANHYAADNKALITTAVFLSMYCKLGLKTAMGCRIRADRDGGLFC